MFKHSLYPHTPSETCDGMSVWWFRFEQTEVAGLDFILFDIFVSTWLWTITSSEEFQPHEGLNFWATSSTGIVRCLVEYISVNCLNVFSIDTVHNIIMVCRYSSDIGLRMRSRSLPLLLFDDDLVHVHLTGRSTSSHHCNLATWVFDVILHVQWKYSMVFTPLWVFKKIKNLGFGV